LAAYQRPVPYNSNHPRMFKLSTRQRDRSRGDGDLKQLSIKVHKQLWAKIHDPKILNKKQKFNFTLPV